MATLLRSHSVFEINTKKGSIIIIHHLTNILLSVEWPGMRREPSGGPLRGLGVSTIIITWYKVVSGIFVWLSDSLGYIHIRCWRCWKHISLWVIWMCFIYQIRFPWLCGSTFDSYTKSDHCQNSQIRIHVFLKCELMSHFSAHFACHHSGSACHTVFTLLSSFSCLIVTAETLSCLLRHCWAKIPHGRGVLSPVTSTLSSNH